MSDVLSPIQTLKFNNILSFGDKSPHFPYKSKSDEIVLTLNLSCAFLRELGNAKSVYNCSYITILNTQISVFQLIENDRLESRIKSQVYLVDRKFRILTGKKRQELSDKVSKIAVYKSEMKDARQLDVRLAMFSKEKIELESKCQQLFDELQESQSRLKSQKCDACETLGDENASLKRYIQGMDPDIKGKVLDDTSTKNVSRKIRCLQTRAEISLWFADTFGLSATQVTFTSENGKLVRVPLNTAVTKCSSYEDLMDEEKQRLKVLVHLMDKFCVGEKFYHELAMHYPDIPRKYLLVQCRNDLDKVFHIERTPGNVPGAYISVKDELSRVLSNWCIENENQVKVKFSGDGVKITRTSGFLVFSFSVVKGRQKTKSSSLQYTVAIVKCSESYDNLRDACMPFLNEVNEIARHGKVRVGDSDVPVELFVGGDMKFLQLILGLNGATSNYACPWCHVEKTNRSDTSKPWNYYHTDDMCRTTRKIKNLYFNRCDNKYGVTHQPLVEVDPDHAVPDELHLLLRIVDVLLRNLIDDVNDLDSVSKVKGIKADRLTEFVEKCNSCGITFQVWKDKAGKLDWTSLTGPDVKKLMCQLPDKLYFLIHRDTHDETIKLWRDFRSIYQLINSNECVEMDPVMLFEKCQSWVELFRDLGKKRKGYQDHNITPYIHCLVYHVPWFVAKYGCLGNFSGQSVERNNADVKSSYLKKCNKIDGTIEVLSVRKRVEYGKDAGLTREKRQYTLLNDSYWNGSIVQKRQSKKRKIVNEMQEVDRKHKYFCKANSDIQSFESWTEKEIRKLLRDHGVTTTHRKRDKLLELCHYHGVKE